MTAPAHCHGVEVDERLWCAERVERLQRRGTEEEKDDDGESEQTRRYGGGEYTPCSGDTRIFGLLTNVTTRFKADQHTSCDIERKHPVPDRRCTCLVECLGENKLGRLEAVGVVDCDGQPDDVEEKVEHDDAGSNAEDGLVSLGIEEVHADGDEKDTLCHDPLDGAKLDVVNVGCKVKSKYGNFGEQEVRGRLTVRRDKGRPRSAAPPCYDEAEQTTVLATSRLGGPAMNNQRVATSSVSYSLQVDRAGSWQSRADLSKDSSGDEDEDTGDDITGPVGCWSSCTDTDREGGPDTTDKVQRRC